MRDAVAVESVTITIFLKYLKMLTSCDSSLSVPAKALNGLIQSSIQQNSLSTGLILIKLSPFKQRRTIFTVGLQHLAEI